MSICNLVLTLDIGEGEPLASIRNKPVSWLPLSLSSASLRI